MELANIAAKVSRLQILQNVTMDPLS